VRQEAQLQKEKELMELSRCLICRGIETILQRSEIEEEKNKTKHRETTINKAMKTTKRAKTETRIGVISRKDVDELWAKIMTSVKLIYKKSQEYG
jgi:hypothetical protein